SLLLAFEVTQRLTSIGVRQVLGQVLNIFRINQNPFRRYFYNCFVYFPTNRSGSSYLNVETLTKVESRKYGPKPIILP
ncbi:hypothetical protein, partial [Leptospira noguchii]|uniref:hypothetical protein n=1 Tax=Leptospira noguchii TaxID=28182 RepID=UPI0038D46379